MNTVAKASLWSLAVALAVPVLLSGAYFIHGSLEEFPTDEQQDKVRTVSALGFILFALLEAVVVVLLRGSNAKVGRSLAGVAQQSGQDVRPASELDSK